MPSHAAPIERLRERLDGATRGALERAVRLAEGRRLPLYLAGGAVRDLLLDAGHLDLDLVVEGESDAYARALAEALEARVVVHPRFGTAVVRARALRLDVARARRETYARPGALPSVAPASIDEDLARRDFSINALALRLDGPEAGALIDPHGGAADLDARLVRVLHERSFQDDATRILRALRYARRLDFAIEGGTRGLLARDLSYLDTITGARLRREIELVAAEARVARIIEDAAALGVLAAVHPALRDGGEAVAALPEAPASHRDALLLCALLRDASPAEAEGAIARLHLTGRQAGAVRGVIDLREQASTLADASLRPSEATAVFARVPVEAVEAFALLTAGLAGERARRHVAEWRHVRPHLDGREIEALGVAHGPEVGRALEALRDARLDGRVRTREDAVAFVRALRSPAEASRG